MTSTARDGIVIFLQDLHSDEHATMCLPPSARVALAALALLGPALPAGGTGPAVSRERVIGTIDFHQDPVRIEVPPAVAAGVPFAVRLVTYGNGCVEKGDTEVRVEGMAAVVTPYDLVLRGQPCVEILRMHEHTAWLRFDAPGRARVAVRGRREPSGEIVTFERSVDVR